MLKSAKEQRELIRARKMVDEQMMLAQQGISSAIENGEIVTIGSSNCDYLNFKHFVLAQIARMGFDDYEDLTGWDHDELIEDLSEEASSNPIWEEDATKFFDGVEGES